MNKNQRKDDPSLPLGDRIAAMLPPYVAREVVRRFNAVCQTHAPVGYCSAYSELGGYLTALTDAGLLTLDLERAIKQPLLNDWQQFTRQRKAMCLNDHV